MTRRPRPLDPADPLGGFAIELRALRDAAGPDAATLDDIATTGLVGRSSIYAILNGVRMPSPTKLDVLVTAWGGDPQIWRAKRTMVLDALRPGSEKPGASSISRLSDDQPRSLSREAITNRVAMMIKTERASRGWSARKLAERCAALGAHGLTRGTIAKIESCARQGLHLDEALALATVFGITVDYLLGRDLPSDPRPQRVPVGETVALVFRVTGYDDATNPAVPVAQLIRINRHGETLASTVDAALTRDDAWHLTEPDALHHVATIPDTDPGRP